jgi:hypothetical protein
MWRATTNACMLEVRSMWRALVDVTDDLMRGRRGRLREG